MQRKKWGLNRNKFKEMMRKSLKRDSSSSTKWRNLSSDVKFFDLKQGLYRIDIIPFNWTWEGVEVPDVAVVDGVTWKLSYYQHPGIGSDDKSYVCLRTIGVPCPICEYRKKLIDEDAKANKDLIEELKPRKRDMFNIIDVTSGRPKKPESNISVFDISYHLFTKGLSELIDGVEDEVAQIKRQLAYVKSKEEREMLKEEIDKLEARYMFTHPEEGLTLKVRFIEEKLGKYTFIKASTIEFLDRAPYPEDIIDSAHKLCDILRIFPYDILEAIFYDSMTYTEAIKEVEKIEKEGNIIEYIKEMSKASYRAPRGIVAKKIRDEEVEEKEIVDDARTDDVDEEIEESEIEPEEAVETEDVEEPEEVRENDINEENEVDESEEEVRLPKFKRTKRTEKRDEKNEVDEEKGDKEPKPKSKVKMECPFGHKFGEESDEHEECADCPEDIWRACSEAWAENKG